MQQLSNKKMLVQAMVGIKAQIVLAFLLAGRALDVNELQEWTGKPRTAHYSPLRALCGMGLLVVQRGEHGRETYLPSADAFPFLTQNFLSLQVSEKSTSGSTTTTIEDENVYIDDVVVEVVQESKKSTPVAYQDALVMARVEKGERYKSLKANSKEIAERERTVQRDRERQKDLDDYYGNLNIPYRANMLACRQFGIGNPMADQISGLKHVRPMYIEHHVRSLVDGESLGLAIVRIKSGELPRAFTTNEKLLHDYWALIYANVDEDDSSEEQ